jgi:hypothetical protein
MEGRAAEARLTADAEAFVRFCYARRPVGWPDLYDEMCLVASRGLFRGWGPTELAEHGIGFSLHELAAVAELTRRVVAVEQAARRAATSRGPGVRVTVGPLEPAREADATDRADDVATIAVAGATEAPAALAGG